MYLSADAVLASINILRTNVHPFIGITFVACKHYDLSIGDVDAVSIDTLTREHMDLHHRIDRRTRRYFQPFRGSASWWVAEKYPSSGLQTVNTQTFAPVFLHPRATREWGFAADYLAKMVSILKERNFPSDVPVDALAVWLLKDAEIGETSTYDELVQLFFDQYNITEEEKNTLFSVRVMDSLLKMDDAFSPDPLEMISVTRQLPEPPDAEKEGGRTITSLALTNAGPAREMKLDFGQRLTIITGDNGLGKSFLLDFAWWAATGWWADREALPQQVAGDVPPTVEYTLRGSSGRLSTFTSKFDTKNLLWVRPRASMTIEAVGVFSRADGSFAVADPVRSKFNHDTLGTRSLSAYEVWNGRASVTEGLIRDWVKWQSASDRKTFDQFASILKRLSPDDLGVLTPGSPVRLPGDPREIPTVQHRYGTVPVTHASSGVQRVLLLSYLIIWTWREHELSAERLNQPPLRRMMVVVDELEAHLHPKWQRIVLPALMGIGDLLSSDLVVQMISATHSPMVLASMEATFDSSIDVLYHLYGIGPLVRLDEISFVKYGDVSGWLTSPVFGLRQARSREAELAIEAAKSIQLQADPHRDEVNDISNKLKIYLAADDKFWPRWLYFAEQHGVKL